MATSGVMTGTAANIIAVGFINSQAGGFYWLYGLANRLFPLAIVGMTISFYWIKIILFLKEKWILKVH